jgi:hypothetical protein
LRPRSTVGPVTTDCTDRRPRFGCLAGPRSHLGPARAICFGVAPVAFGVSIEGGQGREAATHMGAIRRQLRAYAPSAMDASSRAWLHAPFGVN